MSDKNKQHHSIQAMVFDVKFNSETEAFKFQYKLSDLIKSKLMDITEKVLNELVPPDQLIQVKSLTVDLETFSFRHYTSDIPELYEKRLRESLHTLLLRLKGISYSPVDDASSNTPEVGLSKLLTFFLKTGTLPWWAKSTWQAYLTQNGKSSDEKLEIAKIFEAVFQNNPKLLVQFVERSRNDQKILYRLANQVPDFQLLAIIKAISAEKGEKVKRIVTDFEKISSPRFLSLSQAQVRAIVWQSVFLNWDENNEQELVKIILDKLLSLTNHQIHQVEEYFLQLSIEKLPLSTTLATSLEDITNNVSKEKLQKEIYSSEEKIRQLLLQLVSPEEAEILLAYAKDVQNILKHISKQQIWESILDYLWENKQKAFSIKSLSAKVLPQLTHNWEQAAKQLQVKFDENLLFLKDFSRDVIDATKSIDAPERIRELLSQILDETQVDWLWKYGDTLTTMLDTSSKNVWEVLLDHLWESRKKSFTKQIFLKVTFPKVWKKFVKVVAVPSNIPALQDQKMWATPPAPVISQLAQEIAEFKEISEIYWKEALTITSSATSETDSSSLPPEISDLATTPTPDATADGTSEIRDLKKTEMTQALDDGKIKEFIEQVLPGQSGWISEYIEVLIKVFVVDEKTIWEQIIDHLWENRQLNFERKLFLIGSFGKIVDQVASASPSDKKWLFKKTKLQEMLVYYPEFEEIREDVMLTSYYQGVTQTRASFLSQTAGTSLQEIIEKLFTKGILPAIDQTQRALASNTGRSIVSLEETIANLIEAASNNQYYDLNQLLKVDILQRIIEQTSVDFAEALVAQITQIDSTITISDDITQLLQQSATRDETPAFGIEGKPIGENLAFDVEGKLIKFNKVGQPTGENVVFDEDGQLIKFDKDGKSIGGNLIFDDKGQLITFDKEGKPISGKVVFDEDGQLIKFDKSSKSIGGNLIFDDQGQLITFDKEGNPIDNVVFDEDGKLIKFDKDGKSIGGKVTFDAEGKLIKFNIEGKPIDNVAFGEDGKLIKFDKEGKPIGENVAFDEDGKLIKFDATGQPTSGNVVFDEDGNLIKFDKEGEPTGGNLIFDADGNLIKFDATRQPTGGNVVFDEDGNLIKFDKEGKSIGGNLIFDAEGKLIKFNKDGEPIGENVAFDEGGFLIKFDKDGKSIGGNVVFDTEGNLVKFDKDGKLIDAVVFDADGEPVKFDKGRKLIDIAIFDADGNFVKFDKDNKQNNLSEEDKARIDKEKRFMFPAIVSTEAIVEDVDLMVYYLQYFLTHKKNAENITDPDVNRWLKVLKQEHDRNFQYFILSLTSEDIDLLSEETPEITQWAEQIWQQASLPATQSTKAGDAKTEALEKEAYERIKKEIFESADKQRKEVIEQAMYVSNAGLIILHPYLLRLFEMLKLTETNTIEKPVRNNPQKTKKKTVTTFKGDAEKERAVYVLQYLATKTDEAEEHELVLNKVLCGMEVTAPFVAGHIVLTDEEKETCDELLEAVVQNWSILKDSPPDTLRGSFFIREGRLEIKEGNWFLRVEESGVDVLMQHLPWSISMIKLPWMEKVMNVEWIFG